MSNLPTMNTNIHRDHRVREREKFLANGFDGLALHNIIELILFYSIPRKNVNELAHELAKHSLFRILYG